MTIEDPAAFVLSLIPKQMRPVVEELRALVKEAVPEVKEKPSPGTKTFNFDHNGALVAISGYQNWASVGFVRGAEIDDPAGLLEGTGKGMRHVRIARGVPLPREALRRLLQAAAGLNEERGPPKGFSRGWGGAA